MIRSVRIPPEDGLRIVTADREWYLREKKQFAAKFMGPQGDRLFACGPGGCMDPYGYLHPCGMIRDPGLAYDLRKGSLEDAVRNSLPKLRDMKAASATHLERCARCFLKGLCEQCPGKSWAEHGTLDTPVEYCCDVAHTEARYLGLLAMGENAWEIADWQERIAHFTGREPGQG